MKKSGDVEPMISTHLESLEEHPSDLLLAEGTCALEKFGVVTFLLTSTSTSTRADDAAMYLCLPPTTNNTIGMGKLHEGVGSARVHVCGGLGKTGYNVERGKRECACEGLNGVMKSKSGKPSKSTSPGNGTTGCVGEKDVSSTCASPSSRRPLIGTLRKL